VKLGCLQGTTSCFIDVLVSNDVAPREFNLEPRPGLPTSPLAITPRASGFLAL